MNFVYEKWWLFEGWRVYWCWLGWECIWHVVYVGILHICWWESCNVENWKTKSCSRSSVEAEYWGMAVEVQELLWLKLLFIDLGYPPREHIMLYCDIKAGYDIYLNPIQHYRTKHVEVDRFFIKAKFEENVIAIPHLRFED